MTKYLAFFSLTFVFACGGAAAADRLASAAQPAGVFTADYKFPSSPPEKHCHRVVEGKLEDWLEIKDKDTCRALAGRWRKHMFECHRKGVWPPTDMKEASDQFDCASKGGYWSDFGHEF